MISILMLVSLSKNFKNISFSYSNILVESSQEADIWWFMTLFISEHVKNPVQFED